MMHQQDHLASEICGSERAPAVVLLHPICANRDIWRLQVPVWSAYFRVILVDLPGHGLSKPLGDAPQLTDFAAALRATLDAAGIDKVALVGVSLGSMVAQSFALAYPERTRALVLANAGAMTPPQVQTLWDERLRNYQALGAENHVRETAARWFSPSYRASAPLTVNWIEEQIRATSQAGYVGAVHALKGMDHTSRLARIAVPTMVIAGKNDAAVKPEICAGVANAIRDARYAVLPGGHISNVECATAFTELAGGFLLQS